MSDKYTPVLFWALFELVLDTRDRDVGYAINGFVPIREDADANAVFMLRQLCYLCKKLKLECSETAVKEAVDEFLQIERQLPRSWPDTWDAEVPIWQPRFGHPLWGPDDGRGQSVRLPLGDESDTVLVPCWLDSHGWDHFRDFCRRITHTVFREPDWYSLTPKHGPGAVSEPVTGGKYTFGTWPRKLERWFPADWFGSVGLTPRSDLSDREPPSRLIAVPKTQKGPRLIAAEPIAHQYLQQALWGYMEEAVRGSWILSRSIDFRSQESNRKMALDASHSGSYATIDLSAASDRLSTRLVEYVFQGHPLLDGFHAVRTRSLRQEIHTGLDQLVLLRKFSTMGSALTFPVQSYVFWIIAMYASLTVRHGVGFDIGRCLDKSGDLPQVRVFGDDIIVEAESATAATGLLEALGLRVNHAKSHWTRPATGAFRESCGMDAWNGFDVTPAYLTQPYDGSLPVSTVSAMEISNNMFEKGLWNAANAMLIQLPRHVLKVVPVRKAGAHKPWVTGSLGLVSFSGDYLEHLTKKWDRELHYWKYRALGLHVKVKQTPVEGLARLIRYFNEPPVPGLPWSPMEAGRPDFRLKSGWVTK
nr:MAG: hypothetical protein 3 [Leviviridae sp.]